MIEHFLNRIRRRETPLYNLLYRCADGVRYGNIPFPKSVYSFLYYEREFRYRLFRLIMSKLYYEPMFKARCTSVGKRLHLENSGQGIPALSGPLVLKIGNNVRIVDRTTFSGLKLLDNPTLEIGDGSSISHGVSILVAKRVSIGSDCMIGSKLITDNPGHSVRFTKSRVKEYYNEKEIEPVKIRDHAWLAADSVIMKGVTIGEGAIIGAGSVVSQDIPAYSIAVGNPAKVIRQIEH